MYVFRDVHLILDQLVCSSLGKTISLVLSHPVILCLGLSLHGLVSVSVGIIVHLMFRQSCCWDFMGVGCDFSRRHNFTANSPFLWLLPMAQLPLSWVLRAGIVLLRTDKYCPYPSSRRFLFLTSRNHYRKPQWIKMLSCRASSQLVHLQDVFLKLKKKDSPFPSSHQLPTAQKQICAVVTPTPSMLMLTCLILCGSCIASISLLLILWLLHSFYSFFFSVPWTSGLGLIKMYHLGESALIDTHWKEKLLFPRLWLVLIYV